MAIHQAQNQRCYANPTNDEGAKHYHLQSLLTPGKISYYKPSMCTWESLRIWTCFTSPIMGTDYWRNSLVVKAIWIAVS